MFNPVDVIIKLSCYVQLDNYIENIRKTRNINELSELYSYVKVLENKIYHNELNMSNKVLKRSVEDAELLIRKEYLIPYNPKYSYNLKLKDINMNKSESILEYIVNETRKDFYIRYCLYNGKQLDFKDVPTDNLCEDASYFALSICKNLGIPANIYKINPAYTDKEKIYNGHGFHYVVFAKIDNKYYLIDCTYAQFFYTKYNNLNRLGICNLGNCLPGIYMTMTEERIKVANKVLTDGWIEMNASNMKNYLDGFTLSYRNGLYYERNNDFSYQTTYQIKDYIRFIRGEDNTINHEGRKNLGYQHTPLQNPYIKF